MYDCESTVSFNNTCLSIQAVSDIDGELEITVGNNDKGDYANLKEVFRGNIETPNKKIAVITSLNEKLIELTVKSTVTELKVYVNEYEFPSRIVVVSSGCES